VGYRQPAWQRLIVMIGGVTVNFILGILIFALSLWHYGEKSLPIEKIGEKGGIEAYELGKTVGFERGDEVVAVNGNKVTNYYELFKPINFIRGGLNYDVLRDGKQINIAIPDSVRKTVLESKGEIALFGFRREAYVGGVSEDLGAVKAGIETGDRILKIDTLPITYYDEISVVTKGYIGETVPVTISRDGETQIVKVSLDTAGKLGFGEMFKGKLNPVKSVSGPLGIAKIYGSTWDWQRFWGITGMLSFILAFMNLLPIPALDGGHVLFLLIEMVRRKPLPEKVMYYFQVAGMIILFALMGFILFIDFFNAIFN